VPFLGGDAEAERPYYVMPYFPGGSLTKWCGRLTPAQLRAAATQIAEALAALHDSGIAHGDVKPDNLLTNKEGNLHMGDPLGNGGGCTVLYTVNCGGTPGYWAPEVRNGGPISAEADVFSFGAAFFHLATGHRPADGQCLDPWTAGAAIPEDLRNIILHCIQATPSSRPSIHQVVAWLRAARVPGDVQWAPAAEQPWWEDWVKGALVVGAAAAIIALVVKAK
jgi:serine/threonine protein kinase